MKFEGFVGPAYVSRSPNVASEELVNWYPEVLEVPNEKARIVYQPTPGKRLYATLAEGPVRCLFQQDDRAFAVGGTIVYELFADAAPVARGTVRQDANPATMVSSGTAGHQIFITSGGFGYIFDLIANTVTLITAAGFPSNVAMGTYLDSYFLTTKGQTAQFNLSGLLNGLTWSSLDFAVRSEASDNLVAIVQNNKLIWLFGTLTTEVWYDAGAASFPFQSVPQVLISKGCAAPFSAEPVDNSIAWLHQDNTGEGVMYRAEGYTPGRISTFAVEQAWSRYPTIDDAVSYSYTDQGHEFLVVTFPAGNATWVYDTATKLWHRRGWWNPVTANFDRDRGWVHCFAFGMHLVGDWQNGTIYQQDVAYGDDAGSRIVRRRRSPHLSTEQLWNFYSFFQLDMETGRGLATGQGSAPTVTLSWSDDGGHTFKGFVTMEAGAMGQYQMRCYALRLGRSRDRIFQVDVSDAIPWTLLNALVRVTSGTS